MGTVYRGHDTALHRAVAVKLLHAELTTHPTARRRMQQEARALARIDHPNVIRVFDVSEDGQGRLALVLELLPGGALTDQIPRSGLREGTAVRWTQQILSGVQALHDAGLVHRDLKPDNVLTAA